MLVVPMPRMRLVHRRPAGDAAAAKPAAAAAHAARAAAVRRPRRRRDSRRPLPGAGCRRLLRPNLAQPSPDACLRTELRTLPLAAAAAPAAAAPPAATAAHPAAAASPAPLAAAAAAALAASGASAFAAARVHRRFRVCPARAFADARCERASLL